MPANDAITLDEQTVRNLACIRMHLEIAAVASRTGSLMPSLVNFRGALSRLDRIEVKLADRPPDQSSV